MQTTSASSCAFPAPTWESDSRNCSPGNWFGRVVFLGDRREYFSSLGDDWEIFRVVAAERRRREVAPTLSVLRESLLADTTSPEDTFAQQRMREMRDLVGLANNWFDDLQRLSPESMARLRKMGSKVQKLLTAKDRLFGAPDGHGRLT